MFGSATDDSGTIPVWVKDHMMDQVGGKSAQEGSPTLRPGPRIQELKTGTSQGLLDASVRWVGSRFRKGELLLGQDPGSKSRKLAPEAPYKKQGAHGPPRV